MMAAEIDLKTEQQFENLIQALVKISHPSSEFILRPPGIQLMEIRKVARTALTRHLLLEGHNVQVDQKVAEAKP